MSNFLSRYLHWLHLRWPAGVVEKLPRVDEHGQSNVSGLYIVGDLTGIPLLKFSADTGRAGRAAQSQPTRHFSAARSRRMSWTWRLSAQAFPACPQPWRRGRPGCRLCF